MKIITESLSIHNLREMAARSFGDMVKGVVDVDRQCVAVDAELHSDLEAGLLDDGSRQSSLWGINFYPDSPGEGFVEFDSMINIRPSQNNRSRMVEDETMRGRILDIVAKRIAP